MIRSEASAAGETPRVSPLAPIYFLLISAVCQGASFVAIRAALALTELLLGPLDLSSYWLIIAVIIAHGMCAAALARLLGLPRPWQVFNFILLPALQLSFYLHLSTLALALPAVAAFLIYLPTFWTRVPYYPTSRPTYPILADQLPVEGPFRLVDLGSGFGALLIYLARSRPNGTFVGAEISPLPYLVSTLRARILGLNNISFRLISFWRIDLAAFDFVYAFLAPGPMPKLWEKARREMRAGGVFITNTFAVNEDSTETIKLADRKQTELFVHRI